MKYEAEVLADSISLAGVRVTTVQTIYPRFIHSEMLRHRVHSHSVMSSRAVPTEKLIDLVREDPFVPETFNARVKGMGVGAALNERAQQAARATWESAANNAASYAEMLVNIGIDKSRANRLLEPFLPVVDIITGTEWSNFYALRTPTNDDPVPQLDFPAQPEFQIIARMIRDEIEKSVPQRLQEGEWHLPKVPANEFMDGGILPQVSAGRCAKVSFGTHETFETPKASAARQERLVADAHWSPSEHVCRPMVREDIFDDNLANKIMVPAHVVRDLSSHPRDAGDYLNEMWCGNFRGWIQLRKLYELEHDRGEWLKANSRPSV